MTLSQASLTPDGTWITSLASMSRLPWAEITLPVSGPATTAGGMSDSARAGAAAAGVASGHWPASNDTDEKLAFFALLPGNRTCWGPEAASQVAGDVTYVSCLPPKSRLSLARNLAGPPSPLMTSTPMSLRPLRSRQDRSTGSVSGGRPDLAGGWLLATFSPSAYT